MSIKFKPLKDRVFVSYTAELEKTAGGLYIPGFREGEAAERQSRGSR